MIPLRSLLGTLSLALVSLPAAAQEAPRVVASIQPIHGLVAGVMEGVGEAPHLFVSGGDSPHTYAMRPSDAEALAAADAVFWIGPDFEGFLDRPIANLSGDVAATPLIEAPGLVLHEYENGHDHDHGHGHGHAHEHDEDHGHAHDDGHEHAHDEEHGHAHDHEHDHDHGHDDHAHENGHADAHGHVHEGTDGHIWLDPRNARAMVDRIADTLSDIDPDNAETYRANAARLDTRLSELEAETAERLASYADVAYFTFHDAFRYFSERFGLNARGAISIDPDRQPGAQRLAEIRDEIGHSERVCVFSEPQFPPSLVEVVTEGTGAATAVIDPLGADIPEGPEHYFDLIRFNAEAFESCFAQT